MGFTAVQLDAAAAGVRPRELGPSARRDLVARLRRRSLRPVGLDLWIPPAHFRDPGTVDRASDAMLAAIELAADLGRLDLAVQFGPSASGGGSRPRSAPASAPAAGGIVSIESLVLAPGSGEPASEGRPAESDPDDEAPAITAIRAAAEHRGVRLVDFTVGATVVGTGAIGVDPVAWLSAGRSPVDGVLAAGPGLAAVRLADLDASGMRVPPGGADGHLDFAGFAGMLAAGPPVPIAIDPRQWTDPWGGFERAAHAWREVAG